MRTVIALIILAVAAGCAAESTTERTFESNAFIIDCRGEKPRYVKHEEMGQSIKLLGADAPGGLL